MPKPGTGGGGPSGGSIFTTNITSSGTVNALLWLDLGAIPTGSRIWFGSGQYGGPDKALTFELRSNLTGQSAGTDGATVLHGTTPTTTRGTTTTDYYKNGSLHTVTAVGTGTERFWLKVKAKSSTPGSYFFSLNYTTE